MGRKRGRHVVKITYDPYAVFAFKSPFSEDKAKIFRIDFKRSKDKRAKIYYAYLNAVDELDAYNKFKAAELP